MENYVGMLDATRLTDRSAETLRRWMRLGLFPRPTHRRGRRLYWLRDEIVSVLARLNLPVPLDSESPKD